MDLGGHIHPNFFRINLLISLNLMKKSGGGVGGHFSSQRSVPVPFTFISKISRCRSAF